VLAVIVIATVIAVLTYQGATEPWSPMMGAWSGDPVPVNLVQASTPLQLQEPSFFRTSSVGIATHWKVSGAVEDRT